MPNPTKRAAKAIEALAKRNGLTVSNSKLADRVIQIRTLYAGGSSVKRLLNQTEICFAQAGSKGEWVAVLPAAELMKLLEVEAVSNSLCRKKAN